MAQSVRSPILEPKRLISLLSQASSGAQVDSKSLTNRKFQRHTRNCASPKDKWEQCQAEIRFRQPVPHYTRDENRTDRDAIHGIKDRRILFIGMDLAQEGMKAKTMPILKGLPARKERVYKVSQENPLTRAHKQSVLRK